MDFGQLIIDDKITYFNQYLALIKKTVAKQDKEYNEAVEQAKKFHEDQIDDSYTIEDHLSDIAYEHYQLVEILYRSFIVSVFVFIENQTADLCDFLHGIQKEKFSYKDLKGMGITRCIEYIERVSGGNFSNDAVLSEDLNIARIVRNSITHNDGKVNDTEIKMVQKYIKRKPILKLDQDSTIQIDLSYCEELITINQKVISEISRLWREPFPNNATHQ